MALIKKEIIKFVGNEPVEIVLDTEPADAKGITRDSQWGPKTSYTYFTKDGRVMFPSQALHDKLRNYAKGDKITINLIDGKTWMVTSDNAGSAKTAQIMKNVDATESTILLRTIAMDVMQIKAHLFGTDIKTNETKPAIKNTAETKEEDDEIDF